jgi:DNA modification methylase
MKKNLIPLSSIYIAPGEDARIREPDNLKKAVLGRTRSILKFGQLQPILVEEMEEIDGKKWKLLDGQVRYVSLLSLSFQHGMKDEEVVAAFEQWGLVPGSIEATTREAQTPTMSLMMEFHANEDRDGFTWDEKARYIRRIHDVLTTENGKKWTARQTGEAIGQSEATMSDYLALTNQADPATQSLKVLKATTRGAATKQLKIERDKNLRKSRVALAATTEETEAYAHAANLAVYQGDCREWIKRVPDRSLAWFHWDPPYGGDEGEGGAFSAHEAIDTDFEYCNRLMLEMLSEIWRVLHDGAWIAIWYTPVNYQWLRYALQGHRFDPKSGLCFHCKKHLIKDHAWLSSNYSCRPAPNSFWVNPYPNMWRKADRKADGHEITRFFTKETEPFLLAGKQDKTTPILLRSDRGNIFDFNSVPRESRTHVNHKPWGLLAEILSCISVPGSIGGDAGMGSGSIIQGAYETKRRVIGAEIREDNVINSRAIALDLFKRKKLGADGVAPWLEEQMGETS